MTKKSNSQIVLLFARRVREERRKLEPPLSQEALADKAKLHRTYLGGLERGEINPTLANANKVAKALDKELAELLVEKESR